ncbi:MAG: hypothetical protein HQM14_08735 [SAR324 cluster bacterium]|nr:hypothetical protein [SAR324 cluster bacterium]
MMTLKDLANDIQQNLENWEIPFMNFVDNFRRYKDPRCIEAPSDSINEKLDALIASMVEYLCNEQGMDVPQWVHQVPSCQKPWFVSGRENLKAIALAESPLEFRIRKIFVLENFLSRV